jgi:hypothetical protein
VGSSPETSGTQGMDGDNRVEAVRAFGITSVLVRVNLLKTVQERQVDLRRDLAYPSTTILAIHGAILEQSALMSQTFCQMVFSGIISIAWR